MGCKIGMTLLTCCNFVLAVRVSWGFLGLALGWLPFIEPYTVLNKQQCFIWQQRWARARGEVWLGEEHPVAGIFWNRACLVFWAVPGNVLEPHFHFLVNAE
jgi:hypothetical protein